MKALTYIVSICLAMWLGGCSSDERQSTRIPPLPSDDALKRAEVGVEYLSAIIRRSPRNALNYHKRAELYIVLKDFPAALTDINDALEISPSNGLFLLTKARILRQIKRYDEALAAARQAEVLQQDTPELYILLGDLTQQKKQYRQAKLYLSKALQMAPYEGEAYFYNGLLDARQGDTLSGIALMQRAVELKPRFVPAYVELTNIHTRLHDYIQAKDINDQGLRYFPKESMLYYSRGVMYHSQKRLDSALIAYRAAIKFDSTNYAADFQAGTIYLKWNSLPLAIKSFEKVLRYNPKYPQINFLLGSAYDKHGNIEGAIEQYTLATQIDAADWRSRGRLYRAQQRKYYLDTYGTLPPASPEITSDADNEKDVSPIAPERERVQVNILTPRLELKTKSDTVRSLKIRQ
ncbi:tetratricopeptide repeat protein [Runella salmonicolor]|uniref:Tetratricopeptide repeat protein n=1 Tax=Runella salmonicolor TaxID=2950278 RepID=A0ABT1FNI4_9BACT|nr:tetratricopeptide repeat protein [Runella salmonicolor]MCP1382128.1 tetratricopeptide repeat protein [Runella salmonicolor]